MPFLAPSQPLELILRLARKNWPRLAFAVLTIVLIDLLQFYVPRLIKFAVDGLAQGTATPGRLLELAGVMLGLAVLIALLRMLGRPIFMGFGRLVERDLRTRLFDHLLSLDLLYFQRRPPGELMARATSDLNNIRLAAGFGLVGGTDTLLTTSLALGFMVYISPLLAALALLPLPLAAALTRVQSRRLHAGYARSQASFSAMTEQIREVLAAMPMIKSYALMSRQEARLARTGRGLLELNLKVARILAFYMPLLSLFNSLSLTLLLAVGGPLVVLGRITTGDFVAFTAYLALLRAPLAYFGWMVNLLQRAKSSLARIDEIFSSRPAIAAPARPESLDLSAPLALSIRGLSFTYPGSTGPTLQEVDLDLPRGSTLALVGPIGSGKSTLLNLSVRLLDPPPGAILAFGTDVRLASLQELRRAVGQVLQEAFIFSASVRENLLLARPQAGEEELWAALEAADLAGEVRDMEGGLETVLGERGLNLSGGQRQRLTLARALLADPPLLLLDDPLSAVDTGAEGRILKNLARFRAGRTTLMVSHRLASVAFAQTIHVLDGGRIVERGDHDRLMAAGGVYASLFAEQLRLAGDLSLLNGGEV